MFRAALRAGFGLRVVVAALSALLVLSLVLVADGPLSRVVDPPSGGADPRELGALPADSGGVPVRPLPPATSTAGGTTGTAAAAADFEPFAKLGDPSGTRFDPQRSRLVSQSMFTEEYVNPDGTRTSRQSSQPLNVRDEDGRWRPVEVDLAERAGRWVVANHPLRPSLVGATGDGELLSVQADGVGAWLGLADPVLGIDAEVDGSSAVYRDVSPGTDLRYEVTPGSVKETIVLHRQPVGSSWRFTLRTQGLTPRLTPGGTAVELVDGAGRARLVLPPIEAWDARSGDDGPAFTGGGYGLAASGSTWVLTVSVDPAWLRDPKRVFPVSVDPTFALPATDAWAYKSDGFACQNCGVKIGNSLGGPGGSDSYWQWAFYFNYPSLFGQTVVGARMDFWRCVPGAFQRAWPADLWHASGLHFGGMGQHLANAVVGDAGSFSSSQLTAFLRSQVDNLTVGAYFMLSGTEQPGTFSYKNLNTTLYVDTGSAPPAPTVRPT